MPHFSANTATTPIISKKVGALDSSLLSKMSTNTENELLDDGISKEGTHLSKPLSNDDVESKYDEDEPIDDHDIATSSKSTPSEEDIVFIKSFMNIDLCDSYNFDGHMSTSLGELFHVASKLYAPAGSIIPCC
jgi:hypothetical protein